MRLYLTKEFVKDLRESDDARFIRKVLERTIDDQGQFPIDKDDHRFDGIQDAWIRYVTQGKTAFRVIFVRKGEAVYLHRAGKHSVEDTAKSPKDLSTSVPVVPFEAIPDAVPAVDLIGTFLKTWEAEYLSKFFMAMYHLAHDEIILISPFISIGIMDRHHHFGRFLDRAIEEDTIVRILTRPPKDEDIPMFKELETRGAFVYFRKQLHAKLFLFEVNKYKLNRYNRDFDKTAILGSSNLTESGIGFDDVPANAELCYRLPTATYDEAKRTAESLFSGSDDYRTYLLRNLAN